MWLSSAVEVATADESQSIGQKLLFSICSLWTFYTLWLFVDMNQVGVAPLSSF